ncbi:DUF7577 domain-containing protein [Natronorubrum sulfidifaciens]|uniref:DUF7577 domain-containing protein n=1 Tax=Natronorubrum sulfidifaciens JCM 14089 TaxID=1230460 RepID=L9WGY0_9EURY|nr:hypothetical protein [Natronorubrum sulfidifaciens]ELY47583.1 hypothetical protein C495_04967 [Natronorubrum sulfidifaciens JCM 14089]
MELWGWLVGYVLLFALLHLLLYVFYARGDDDVGSPSFVEPNHTSPRTSAGSDRYPGSADDVDPDDETDDNDLEFDGETMRCPHCGVRNEADQTFTYCWNCISSLRQ